MLKNNDLRDLKIYINILQPLSVIQLTTKCIQMDMLRKNDGSVQTWGKHKEKLSIQHQSTSDCDSFKGCRSSVF